MAKQRKYAVFSIRELKSMIKQAESWEDGSPKAGGDARTVVLRFQSAGKKFPGQLESIIRRRGKNRFW